MHGTKEERLAIGKRVHDGELTRSEASKEYGVPEIAELHPAQHSRISLRIGYALFAV